MQIKYIGNISPARVNVRGSIIHNWKTGETRELEDIDAQHLLKQRYFVEEKTKTTKKEEKQEKEEVSPAEEEETEPKEAKLTSSATTITSSNDDSKQIEGDE